MLWVQEMTSMQTIIENCLVMLPAANEFIPIGENHKLAWETKNVRAKVADVRETVGRKNKQLKQTKSRIVIVEKYTITLNYTPDSWREKSRIVRTRFKIVVDV